MASEEYRVQLRRGRLRQIERAASREAKKLAALDGITLEETYTAKAFAALVDAVRSESAPGKTFLFWQTNSQDNDE